jgi:hypothetical protein
MSTFKSAVQIIFRLIDSNGQQQGGLHYNCSNFDGTFEKEKSVMQLKRFIYGRNTDEPLCGM